MSVIAPLRRGPDAGVIKDARDRQRRRHSVLSAVALLLLAGALVYSAVGGGAAGGTATASLETTRGAVTFVSLRTPGVGLVASPSLTAGAAGLCVSETGFAAFGGCQTPEPYPQKEIPLEAAEGGFPIASAGPTGGVGSAGRVYVLLAAPGVAAVRVGSLGTVRAQDAPGLPPGDRAVAFRLAAREHVAVRPPGQLPQLTETGETSGIVLVALDRSGHPIAGAGAAALSRLWLPLWPHVSWPVDEFTTGPDKACMVTSADEPASSYVGTLGVAADGINAQPAAAPSAFIACANSCTSYAGKFFQVALLLNARDPGASPRPLWDARPLHGHPDIVTVPAPGTQSKIVARRVGDAWLVVAPYPKISGDPTRAQALDMLALLHVTGVDTTHA